MLAWLVETTLLVFAGVVLGVSLCLLYDERKRRLTFRASSQDVEMDKAMDHLERLLTGAPKDPVEERRQWANLRAYAEQRIERARKGE